tara:strand:+ start:1944 stop:2774 length:831 start_codon:yes stop_codon:yes gene_type:complete
MKIQHLILEKIYKVFGERFLKKPRFRILNIHDVNEKDFENLEKIIFNLKKNWNFIDPSKLQNLNNINKNHILITFDDGYKSQKIFADKVLNRYKIKALFFVVTNFIKCNSKQEAQNFVLKNIDTSVANNPSRFSEINNMNFDDLKELIAKDNLIGSHTVNHKKLTKIDNVEELNYEIVHSKNELEKILNSKINNFAWTYGDINSINKVSYNIIKKHYENIFSGIRGDNFQISSHLYFRDELSPFYSEDLANAFLNGYSDFYYYKKRKKLLTYEEDV